MIHTKGVSKSVAVQHMFQFIVDNSDKDKPIYIVSHNGLSFDFIFFRKSINYINKVLEKK